MNKSKRVFLIISVAVLLILGTASAVKLFAGSANSKEAASDGKETEPVANDADKQNEGENIDGNIDFSVQYVRTDGYVRDVVKYPVVTVVRSTAELDDYYRSNREEYYLDHVEKVYSDTTVGFVDACAKYDEDYFKNRELLIVLLEEGSGSIRHRVNRVCKNSGGYDVYIERIIPDALTEDMAEWHILIELDSSFGSIDASDVHVLFE